MILFRNTSIKIFFILFVLTVINIFQGRYTELLADEAYYWTYSNFLDWGYFDHPPMVAIWITISKFFFNDTELSVRFFSAISYSVSVFLVWKTIANPKKEHYLNFFFLVIFASVLFSVYGFITVPDTPLMFFFALFLLGYKRYVQNKNTISYLLIIISVVGLLYSKYQAVLIVFFVLLSNFKLLKDYKLWISLGVILLLFLPHLYWQYLHDFVTFKYHLVDRSAKAGYNFSDTLLHFGNCMVIVGPTFPLVYLAAYKNLKTPDVFNKGLNYIIIGFISFFFLMTFKGHVQAQWIVPIAIPLVIISFNYFIENPKYYKLLTRLSIVTICLVAVARILIIVDVLPVQLDFHGNKKWVATIKNKLDDKTPLFIDSYQKTSLFWFYSGVQPHQYNSLWGRNNQYNLYEFNKSFTIKNSLVVGVLKQSANDSIIEKNTKKMYLNEVSNLSIANNIEVTYPEIVVISEGLNTFPITLKNIDENFVPFSQDIHVYFFDNKLKFLLQVKATIVSNKENVDKKDSLFLLEFTLPNNINNSKISNFKLGVFPDLNLQIKGVGGYKKCVLN